jgi:hypothetical protein
MILCQSSFIHRHNVLKHLDRLFHLSILSVCYCEPTSVVQDGLPRAGFYSIRNKLQNTLLSPLSAYPPVTSSNPEIQIVPFLDIEPCAPLQYSERLRQVVSL